MLFKTLDIMCPKHRTKCHVHYEKWAIRMWPNWRQLQFEIMNWVVFIQAIFWRLNSRSGYCILSCAEQLCQISFSYTPCLPVHGGDCSKVMHVSHIGWRPLQWPSSAVSLPLTGIICGYLLSQWEMASHCNAVSLAGPYPELSLPLLMAWRHYLLDKGI